MDKAWLGKTAIEAGDYKRAQELYTEAIKVNPISVDYHLQRSIVNTRLHPNPNYKGALDDADVALMLAVKRQRKELIVEAHLRRAIALCNLGRIGDADFVIKVARRIQGPSYGHNSSPSNPMLDMWEKRVQTKVDDLKPDDPKLKVSVKEMPGQIMQSFPPVADAGGEDEVKVKEEKRESAVTQMPSEIRHDWYQSFDQVYVTVYAKSVSSESAKHEIKEDSVHVSFPAAGGEKFELTLNPLYAKIVPAESKFTVSRNGVELQLKKVTKAKWKALQSDLGKHGSYVNPLQVTPAPVDTSAVAGEPVEEPPAATHAPLYPTSAKSGGKDWEKIVMETLSSKEDNEEFSDDDDMADGVDKFFKRLYKNADPDTKRAMMKSFTESDGTALSTNWEDVKQGRVEPKHPSDDSD